MKLLGHAHDKWTPQRDDSNVGKQIQGKSKQQSYPIIVESEDVAMLEERKLIRPYLSEIQTLN